MHLGVEDIGNLGDHALGMGKRGLVREAVDRLEFREVHPGRRLERKVRQLPVPALEVGMPPVSKRIQALQVLPPVLVAFRPGDVTHRVGFPVRNGDIPRPALLHVPYHLFHHHQVSEVGVAGGHEPGQDVKGPPVPYCLCDLAIVAVADHDAASDERRHAGEDPFDACDRLDAKHGEKFLDIVGLLAGPGV
ncbi:MAG: hypothetical protein A4E39_00064 [Methanoregulaceae archaeon PtaB.Bin152]|nr:MAG: hypothetical protein A4E39_00064 [Methanoregulaceae archaeon PtaB.Bin152]